MISKNGESSEVHPPHRMMMIFFQLLSNSLSLAKEYF
jgi:hypothetical protein